MTPAGSPTRPDKAGQFVSGIFTYCTTNKGLAARLRRADNPDTETQSWEVLAAWRINLEWEDERLPYATVAAAIARSKQAHNGSLSLGRALAACYDNNPENAQGKARLRRLLACHTTPELCRILRPLLRLIENKVSAVLDYHRLLNQLLRFQGNPQRIKAQWAGEFYGALDEEAAGND
ncbi:type I-E CRISPR-associated protein Cse2/CasB [Chimaeribacter coloradensis]|uniref:Type I-E CRISPR-associated protein Cse2/CasB n=1 Tax=Chimaeribacter coloradensis TaxID=2060068 RepID=A0A2N5E4V2_9GAMM|nr:type I-E CRISPR-associated protein Cse2/CasB [Chimaeribacter coloradensis]PLR36020.1 type I-E CRISPR-associated protein Cse2/CasB [Chimaeribacter coloradensis]